MNNIVKIITLSTLIALFTACGGGGGSGTTTSSDDTQTRSVAICPSTTTLSSGEVITEETASTSITLTLNENGTKTACVEAGGSATIQ